jgi:hypothetical protein
MRLLYSLFFAAGVLFSWSAITPTHADTCTAPGHASCTKTCPDGCGALYVEPNGPCYTICSEASAAEKARGGAHSAHEQSLTREEHEKLFKEKKK